MGLDVMCLTIRVCLYGLGMCVIPLDAEYLTSMVIPNTGGLCIWSVPCPLRVYVPHPCMTSIRSYIRGFDATYCPVLA